MIFLGRGQIKRDQSTSGGKTFSFSNLKDMTEDMTCVGSMDLDVEEETEPVQVTRYEFYWKIFDIHTGAKV